MKCSFCEQYVNEKRQTTYYTFVPRKNGTMKKVRWCKQCDESKADQIDQFLREHDELQAIAEKG
jgi:hypothetical protein